MSGWPQGLFGRRDALILTLVAAGLTYTEIAALRRGDMRRQGHELVIDSARTWRLGPAGESAEHGPAAVYGRWARVQEILDGFPNARMLAHYFEHPPEPVADRPAPVLDAGAAEQPLIVSIDRWGYTPLRANTDDRRSRSRPSPEPTFQARRRRTGAARRCRRTAWKRPRVRPATTVEEAITLDPRYYRRGVTARRRAHAWLTNVGDELDGVAGRAEELLEQLAAIVGDAIRGTARQRLDPAVASLPVYRGKLGKLAPSSSESGALTTSCGAAAPVPNQGVLDQLRGEILGREQDVVALGLQPRSAQSGGSIRP